MKQKPICLLIAATLAIGPFNGAYAAPSSGDTHDTQPIHHVKDASSTHNNLHVTTRAVEQEGNFARWGGSVTTPPYLAPQRDKFSYIVEFTSPDMRESVKAALGQMKDVKVLYDYSILFQAVAVETYPEVAAALRYAKGVKSVEVCSAVQPLSKQHKAAAQNVESTAAQTAETASNQAAAPASFSSVEREQARKLINVDKAIAYLKALHEQNPDNPIAQNYDGRGMRIAHMDTGMDAWHQDMRIDPDAKGVKGYMDEAHLSREDKPFYINEKVPHSFNYLTGGKVTKELGDDGEEYADAHGMHIAGILAANAKDPTKGVVGVAPNAQILSYKIYSDISEAFAGDETMFHAFEDAISHHADVISISSGFHGTGLVGEKYWSAIRHLRDAGIPVCVAAGNYATSAADNSWDLYPDNALNMIDTGNQTRTAAHEDAISVASARNNHINLSSVSINGHEFPYAQIGVFFDENKVMGTSNDPQARMKDKSFKFIYLGKCQDEDIAGKDLAGKIVVMDRIFSTDMKYAFKKVRDKGAVAVIVVNTVSYYNRDNWKTVPAIGYERDDHTHVQVFSLSGNDGKTLWDMITNKADQNQNTPAQAATNGTAASAASASSTATGTAPAATAQNLDYSANMDAFDAHKPKIGQEKELPLHFTGRFFVESDNVVPAGSTSWGPRTDLLLKPDVSAPGKNIYSTLNNNAYAYDSGTSMAAPFVSASTVLIRPRLKELVKDANLVAANIDLVTLTKIMLQNTAHPMVDPTTSDQSSAGHLFASPRQQGAGLIDVLAALKNNVVVSSAAKGSDGAYNEYGAVSLREIKGASKHFDITLRNTSDAPCTFNVSSSSITTDGETSKVKLDENFEGEGNAAGKKTVAEIHPVKVKGASVHFDAAGDNGSTVTITVPAHGTYNLAGSLNVGEAANANKFVEGFLSFKSQTANQPDLSMPFMGFAGNWNAEEIIDKWAWEKGSRSGHIVGYDEEGKLKRPGTLNVGVGGEHDIDMFHPEGVIQNTADGNPNQVQDPTFFSLNNVSTNFGPGNETYNAVRAWAKHLAAQNPSATPATPTGTTDDTSSEVGAQDSSNSPLISNCTRNKSVVPAPLILRSCNDAKVSIVNQKDEKGQRVLRTLAVQQFIRGILNSRANDAKGMKMSKLKVNADLRWDGQVYSPKTIDVPSFDTSDSATHQVINPGLTSVAEGQYWYKFQYRLTPDYPYQVSYIPVKVDNTAPEIVRVDASNPASIKIFARDSYHQQKDVSKTEFDFDQILHPEAFETKYIPVWQVDAGFVDGENNLQKKLKVLKVDNPGSELTSEDKQNGISEYTIEDVTNELLPGKTLEIVALDGCSNFSKRFQVQFGEAANGTLPYTCVSDADNSNSPKQQGVIQNLQIAPAPSTPSGSTSTSTPSSEPVSSQKPTMAIDYKQSDIEKDLSKIVLPTRVKPKHYQKKDPYTDETIDYEDTGEQGKKDSDGKPLYDDGTPIETVTATLEDHHDGSFSMYFKNASTGKKEKNCDYAALVKPLADGGFDIRGTLYNVSPQAKLMSRPYINGSDNHKGKEVVTYNFRKEGERTALDFDLYANTDDISNEDGYDFSVDQRLCVVDQGKETNVAVIKITTDHAVTVEKSKVCAPAGDGLDQITECGGTKKTTATPYTDTNNNTYYVVKDHLKLQPGYAVKITSYNPGKTGLEPLFSKTYYCDSTEGQHDYDYDNNKDLPQFMFYVPIRVLQGFNQVNYQVFKIACDENGKAKMPLELIDDKQSAQKNIVSEEGKCIYVDMNRPELRIDKNFFNPVVFANHDAQAPGEAKNVVYIKHSPLKLKGTLGDKGGFNWKFRINESQVNEYLIYGDLTSDNTRPFSVTIPCEDGDRLDWAASDYVGNQPDHIADLNGEQYQPTYHDQYYIYLDNVKPTLKVECESSEKIDQQAKQTGDSLSIPYSTDSRNQLFVNIAYFDKRSEDPAKPGKIQRHSIKINGKEYDPGTPLKAYAPLAYYDNDDNQFDYYKIDVTAVDYAGNVSATWCSCKFPHSDDPDEMPSFHDVEVKTDKKSEKDKLKVNLYRNVTKEDASNPTTSKVFPGEDFTLPECMFKAPDGKVFNGWILHDTGRDVLHAVGESFIVKTPLTFKASWVDAPGTQSAPVTVTYEKNGGANGVDASVTLPKGSTYTLPKCSFTAPDKQAFKAWSVNGATHQPGDTVTVSENTLVTALWAPIVPPSVTLPPAGETPGTTDTTTPGTTDTTTPGETVENPQGSTSTPEAEQPTIPDTPIAYPQECTSVQGATAEDTMQYIVNTVFDGTTGAVSEAVLAGKDSYLDALSANALAGNLHAPVLLTNIDALPAQTIDELQRLKVKNVVVCGGTNVISSAVEQQLADMNIHVKRVAGQWASDTANSIATQIKNPSDTCFIATSWGYADALSASSYAYEHHAPIFLTNYDSAALDDNTIATIKKGGYKHVYIVGGENVVSSDVEAQLADAGIAGVQRVAGETQYDTSAQLAQLFISKGMSANNMVVSTGWGYADALCGAALCAQHNSVMILADDSDQSAIEALAHQYKQDVKHYYILGGQSVVGATTIRTLEREFGAE